MQSKQLLATACLLSMPFLALSACAPEPKRIVTALRPPAERMECQTAGTRPIIPPEHFIDWARVVTAGDARAEHEAFVTKLREREGLITGYLVRIEGALFVCSNNAQWMREFFAGLPGDQPNR